MPTICGCKDTKNILYTQARGGACEKSGIFPSIFTQEAGSGLQNTEYRIQTEIARRSPKNSDDAATKRYILCLSYVYPMFILCLSIVYLMLFTAVKERKEEGGKWKELRIED